MSFLTSQQKELAPQDVIDFRKRLESMIGQFGATGQAGGFTPGTDIAPFQKMFGQTRAEALATAKEQSGNLTGSGFANVMGVAAGRSAAEENAFLANLISQNQQANAQRMAGLFGIPGGMAGQMGTQPGFLDYLFQGAQAAAPLIAAL